MARVFNRARVSTATTGTGTITLGAVFGNSQSFATAGAVTGDIIDYVIEDGTAWEVGYGTYNSAGPTLTRTLIQSSTGLLLSLSGSANVFSSPNDTTLWNRFSVAMTAGTNAQGQGVITADLNVFTTAASNPSGATLPAAAAPRRVVVVNRGANPINIYPASGATIDTLAANASIQLASGDMIEFIATSTTQWYSNAITNLAGTLTLINLPGAWVKKAVDAATTANITLSATQTIDGIAVVAGNRVLVKNQTTASANGIYVVAAGAWTRDVDADTADEIAGATVSVDKGTVNGGSIWTTNFKPTDTLGATAMYWQALQGATGGGNDGVFHLNDTTVTTSYTLPTGKNAGTFGPVTINSGVTVTVPSGQVWTIV